ncbi:MAG: O-antigen ligase family protein, partial [Bacteroidetes bacterium]|nr:O-antigen ligase family protein [Bacteroidota bacterium]
MSGVIQDQSRFFKSASYLISALLCIQLVWLLFTYFGDPVIYEEFLNKADTIQLNAGNKNILAATLMMKYPFFLYALYISKGWLKVLYGFMLAGFVILLFLISSRSSFISFSLVTLIYVCWMFLKHKLISGKRNIKLEFALIVFPILCGIVLANGIIKNSTNKIQDKNTVQNASVVNRVASIQLNNQASNGRIKQWKDALNYIWQRNIFQGSGVGNWKLASIQYEKNFNLDYVVNLNVHNDFIQLAAEGGIQSFIGFVFLIIMMGYLLI